MVKLFENGTNFSNFYIKIIEICFPKFFEELIKKNNVECLKHRKKH